MRRSIKLFQILMILIITSACISTNFPKPPAPPANAPTPTGTPITNITATPYIPMVDAPIKLAWFYKPPADGNFGLVADKYDFFIMVRGDEKERDQMISLGAKKPILQYLRFEAIMDPKSCTRQPWQSTAANLPGDFCMIQTEHPDWFLRDQDGQIIIDPYSGEDFVIMDPGNAGWRAFFLERLRQTQDADPNWGGVFLDNVEITRARLERIGKIPPAYPDEQSYQKAVQGFLQYLRDNYFRPSGRYLFANFALTAVRDQADWTDHLGNLDGVMHEGWAIDWPNGYRPVKLWETQMKLAEDTQALGKFIVLVSHGTFENIELQEFAFASYLLINQGRAAFRYVKDLAYNQAWLYENYEINLGPARGFRYRDGNAWRRDFAHGSVLVNPETHEVQINIKQ